MPFGKLASKRPGPVGRPLLVSGPTHWSTVPCQARLRMAVLAGDADVKWVEDRGLELKCLLIRTKVNIFTPITVMNSHWAH